MTDIHYWDKARIYLKTRQKSFISKSYLFEIINQQIQSIKHFVNNN